MRAFYRFLISGGLNTGISYFVYIILLAFTSYAWAYTMAYAVGIMISYLLSRYYVFHGSGGKYGLLWVVVIYMAQYFLGLALVWVWVVFWVFDQRIAPIFSVFILIPLTYVLNRKVFSRP